MSPNPSGPISHVSRKPRLAQLTKLRHPPPSPSSVSVLNEKPTSLGAAMKLLLKTLPAPWTQEQLLAALNADADYAKLLAEASRTTFSANLVYWVKTGKLQQTDAGYTNLKF